MRFGDVPIAEAEGAILAHSLKLGSAALKKGRVKTANSEGPLLRVAPFRPLSVGLVQTRLPGLKESILDKTREVTEGRLKGLGCRLALEERCGHTTGELAALIRDMLGHGID